MSVTPPASNAAQTSPAADDATTAIGGRTSGQQGATPTHESQQETGGNGGPGLTRNQAGPDVNAPDGSAENQACQADGAGTAPPPPAPRTAPRFPPDDPAMTHSNPGAQDTRASQSGPRDTGLGAPETGGNQDAGDLPPPRP